MQASFQRVSWIARVTFLEAVRQRFFAFLLILGAAMALSSVSFRVLDFGHGELKFIADFGFGGMFLFGSVLAVVMTAQLFFSEMDNKTALTLLAKPLGRGEFLLGKFAGAWAVLGVFVAVLSVLLGVVLWAREQELLLLSEQSGKVPPAFSATGLAQFALLQWLRLGVVASIVLAISAVARTFLYAVVVGGCFTLPELLGDELCLIFLFPWISAFVARDVVEWGRRRRKIESRLEGDTGKQGGIS